MQSLGGNQAVQVPVRPVAELFRTKAETLQCLETMGLRASIPESYYFTVAEWKNREACVDEIVRRFRGRSVAVRSSALDEDQQDASMAGKFSSVLEVPADDRIRVASAVDQVFSSYNSAGSAADGNQVLVQEMVTNVSMSGVVFTQDMNTGAPYVVINYDDETGKTDTVTSGTYHGAHTLYFHRGSFRSLKSPRFLSLLEAVREIEEAVSDHNLDIEFAVTKDLRVHVFQVRHISTLANWNRGISIRVDDQIERMIEFFDARQKPTAGTFGTRSVFGQMPDWNPAEMIGRAPRPLAFSLYHKIITESAWRNARAEMGYQVPIGAPLMVSFGGQPYIDVRQSFHSYLPSGLSAETSNKLVDAWLDRLAANPHLHDKVEFEVAITVLDFCFEQRVEELIPGVLTPAEQREFRSALYELTHKTLQAGEAAIDYQLAKVEEMAASRQRLIEASAEPDLAIARQLLEECVPLGTIPFSILARHGFIAKSMLDSLIAREALTREQADAFIRSVHTVANDLIEDIRLYGSDEMDEAEFFTRYGHLRPSSYDILSPRYDQRSRILQTSRKRTGARRLDVPWTLRSEIADAVARLVQEFQYSVDPEDLFAYMGAAIRAREFAKFRFTANLSDAMEIIARWGEQVGLSRDELSYLNVDEILETAYRTDGRTLENHLRSKFEGRRRDMEITTAIRLPYIIKDRDDFMVVALQINEPNFVGGGTVCARVCGVDARDDVDHDLNGCIVAIEGADPGYDWIFTHQIVGLVTKFGGANSHMAIRCAEFGLPAAIGVGEQTFARAISCHELEIDTQSKSMRFS